MRTPRASVGDRADKPGLADCRPLGLLAVGQITQGVKSRVKVNQVFGVDYLPVVGALFVIIPTAREDQIATLTTRVEDRPVGQ